MKANLITKQVMLDYTGIAEPLKIDDIHHDIGEVQSRYFEEPDVIVLWEHQADWLSKQLGTRCAVFGPRLWDNRVGDTGRTGENGTRLTTIYGVKVRYANL